jgi:uncharacterized protein (TIGR02453 family)
MPPQTRFTQASIDFLNLATRQKKPEWIEKNRDQYQDVLVAPMRELVTELAKNLRAEAPGYRFPTRSFARLKRPDRSPTESLYRDYVHSSVSRDSESLYDSLPNLYFHFADGDFYTAGGLYMPGSDQTKHIRSWVAKDPSLFEALFEDAEFTSRFKAFGTERMLKTKPRDYPIDHPMIHWLKLSGWYVWRPLTKKVVLSKNLLEVVTDDWREVLKLNRILDRYITTWPTARTEATEIGALPVIKRPIGDWE